jgi:hypothetical protein
MDLNKLSLTSWQDSILLSVWCGTSGQRHLPGVWASIMRVALA